MTRASGVVAGGSLRAALDPGTIALSWEAPDAVAAGSLARFTATLRADVALPAGTLVAFARRWPSDWGTPQWARPDEADYLRVVVGNGVPVQLFNARMHSFHPFDHVTMIELLGAVPPDTEIRFGFGDGHGGSPGFAVQTFIEEASPLSIRISQPDPARCAGGLGADATASAQAIASRRFVEIARPTIRVVGGAPACLVFTAPSRAVAGVPFAVHLRVEDTWGNPSRLDQPIRVAGRAAPLRLPDCGWCRFDMTVAAPGVTRLEAIVEGRDGFAATSNPIDLHPASAAASRDLLVWGDPHAQSVIGCGARTIDAFFTHARDFAATDFSSHQANCFLVSNDDWVQTQQTTRELNEDGRFVTLLGVEWSAASPLGGDHNLYFPGDAAELRRCSHEFVADKSDVGSDLRHVDDLHAHYRGSDTLVAVHVGGRTADLRHHEPSLDRLIEVHSTHATSEWFLLDALRRGYRMGVTAGSDGVDGRPGASHPGRMAVRNVRGGLTAVETPTLTRSAVYEALKARRCYATTGERILLSVKAGRWRMGDEVVCDRARGDALPPFEVRVEGTAAIEAVDFFRDEHLLETRDLLGAGGTLSNRLRVSWQGASGQGNWQRARMQWDGSLRIDGARIIDAQAWAFDSPDETLERVDEHQVRWRCVTAGDADGVVLTIDPRDRFEGATLAFAAAPLAIQLPLGGIDASGWRVEAQDPWRRLEIRRLPVDAPPRSFSATFEDGSPEAGDHAYWVRVRQVDGAMAWSTPIFVLAAKG